MELKKRVPRYYINDSGEIRCEISNTIDNFGLSEKVDNDLVYKFDNWSSFSNTKRTILHALVDAFNSQDKLINFLKEGK